MTADILTYNDDYFCPIDKIKILYQESNQKLGAALDIRESDSWSDNWLTINIKNRLEFEKFYQWVCDFYKYCTEGEGNE